MRAYTYVCAFMFLDAFCWARLILNYTWCSLCCVSSARQIFGYDWKLTANVGDFENLRGLALENQDSVRKGDVNRRYASRVWPYIPTRLSIPATVGRLTRLTGLDLTRSDGPGLPESLNKLTDLTSLCLTEANLNEIPSFIQYLTKLTFLSLSNNNALRTIPLWFARLSELNTLYIDCTDIWETNNLETVTDGTVGSWGGTCTCPDGKMYGVGDNTDYCATLACVGGTSGACNRHSSSAWSNKKVTCARAGAASDNRLNASFIKAHMPHLLAYNSSTRTGLRRTKDGQYSTTDVYDYAGPGSPYEKYYGYPYCNNLQPGCARGPFPEVYPDTL